MTETNRKPYNGPRTKKITLLGYQNTHVICVNRKGLSGVKRTVKMAIFRAILQAAKRAFNIKSIDIFFERQEGPKWIEFNRFEAREGNGEVHHDYVLSYLYTVANFSLARYTEKN